MYQMLKILTATFSRARLCCLLSHCTPLTSNLTPFSLYPPTGYCCLQLGSSMSLLFSRLKKPSLPRVSSCIMRSQTILVVLHWTHSATSTSLFSWGAQNWAPAGSVDTALQTLSHNYHAELKNHFRRPASYILANSPGCSLPFFCYKSTLLTHIQFLSISIPKYLSAKLLSSQPVHPHLYH